ncbi:alpha/beta-hydrolase [Exidia glandulosa HHB12029]|uniref:feruloyl esterase n=1 Tax=Exidia glandulosa HHB12029 TaxID=1314781 RepID=A0A165HE21_EXIGL|nr:alpha/beta-hydrolase [Exidia glandulosa HHB12029]
MRLLVIISLALSTLGSVSLSPCLTGLSRTSIYTFDETGHATRTLPNNRTYLVHIPKDYSRTLPINLPHPVVLSYHGNGGTSAKQETLSQWSEENVKLNGLGVIGVYPQASLGLSRNGGAPTWSWQGAAYASPDAHDLEFTGTILDELKANLCIDSRRVYATGKSNGGGFTNLVACTEATASRLAAVAIVSGAMYPGTLPDSECSPGRPLPVYISHGVVDQTIPYLGRPYDSSGDTIYRTPNIDDFAAAWADRNGLAGTDYCQKAVHGTAQERVWGSSGAKGQVRRIRVDGLGHSWPTTLGLDSSGAPNNTANFNLTTAHLVSFFNAHVLPL